MENTYQTLSIASFGEATLPKAEKRISFTRDPNNLEDIDGAKSAPRYKLYSNKPQFLNSEVDGAVPRKLIRERNVQDNSLYIDDIEGTRHTIKDRMMRTKRSVNPLDPKYNLPTFAPVETIPARFLRDSLNVDDIDGSKSKVKKEFSTRDNLFIDDIEGSRSGNKQRRFLASIAPREILETKDVAGKRERFSRLTDPNRPIYRIHGMIVSDDNASHPKKPRDLITESTLLRTDDIIGATSSSHTLTRKEIKNTNFISDIEGACADSIKHSIRTTRATNPLQPVYQSLDPGDSLLPLIPPLVPPSLVRKTCLSGSRSGSTKSTGNNYSGGTFAERRNAIEHQKEVNSVRNLP